MSASRFKNFLQSCLQGELNVSPTSYSCSIDDRFSQVRRGIGRELDRAFSLRATDSWTLVLTGTVFIRFACLMCF